MKKIFLSLSFILLALSLCGCKLFNKPVINDKEVVFIINGEEIKTPYSSGKKIDFPDDPVIEGANFIGWYVKDSETKVSEDTSYNISFRANLIIEARFEYINYNITYDLDGGENNINNPKTYTINDEFSLSYPTKGVREFLGWNVNGNSTVIKDYKITKGMHENISLKAVFEKLDCKVTYVNADASLNTIVKENSCITRPTLYDSDMDFINFYSDATCKNIFDFSKPITSDTLIYAKFASTSFYKLTIVNDEYIESNYENNSEIMAGASLEFEAQPSYGYKEFKGWMINSSLVSTDLKYCLTMPNYDVSVEALYEVTDVYTYDKASNIDLVFEELNYYPGNLFGNNISPDDYDISISGLVIKKSYLNSLDCGTYSFIFSQDTIIKIKVIQTDDVIRNYRIDYDINYPKATIIFDEILGKSYMLSINGDSFYSIHSKESFILDKKENNEIKLICGSESVTLNTVGYKSSYEKYFTETFTYNGNTYDKYIDSEEELDILFDYMIYVIAPNYSADEEGARMDVLINLDNVKSVIGAPTGYIFNRVSQKSSIPFAVSTGIAVNASGEANLVAHYVGELNTVKSNQEVTVLTDYELELSTRSNSYDDFKINNYTKTQEIRTLYELEELDYGVKPIFSDTTSKAYLTYNYAKDVCRTYINDSMSDYEKIRVIYDWLSINVTYDNSALNNELMCTYSSNYAAYTSYGLFKNRVAVCDGYASALKLMCQIEGINAIEVIGEGNGGGHAWNKVFIDGNTYGIDVTWSRVKDGSTGNDRYITHKYLFIDEIDLMDSNHFEEKKNDHVCNIEYVADCKENFYQLTRVDGVSLYVTSSEQLKTLVNYYKSKNVKMFDIYAKDMSIYAGVYGISYTGVGASQIVINS